MTNREKFKEQILNVACSGNIIAVDKETSMPVNCDSIGCNRCALSRRNCRTKFKEWCNDEYVEPPVDWSKVPVDTPILVKNIEWGGWYKAHFAKAENGKIYTWFAGRTSWTTEDMNNWIYAKIPTEEKDDV